MKIAVHLARHRRLVALGGLSLLLHLLAFAWIDALVAPPPPPRIGAPLALRLVHEDAPAKKAIPAQPPAEASAPFRAREGTRPALPAMQPLLPASDAAAGATVPARASAAAPGIAPLQMPGRYRVRPPPSSRLSYAVTRSAPGQAAVDGETAQLAWEYQDGSYRLRLDGVLGQLESAGGEDDAGIAPDQTRGGSLGSQDPASVLMQLAGIGLAEPDQVQDVIDIVVAGAAGARVNRWQVLGKEELATPAGVFATVRLAQMAPAGEARVEVWLAPQRSWLPVQLRVTHPDGTAANQVVVDIDTAAPSVQR